MRSRHSASVKPQVVASRALEGHHLVLFSVTPHENDEAHRILDAKWLAGRRAPFDSPCTHKATPNEFPLYVANGLLVISQH